MRPRPTRRGVLAGGAASLAALAGCRSERTAADIQGGFADRDLGLGHRLRDGGLPSAEGAAVRRADVLVVGGGAAGLAAAWRLRRAGVEDVAVLELADSLGGTSRGGETAGLAHPWGAHYLPLPRPGQRALLAFLEEAGLAQAAASGEATTAPENLVRAPQERVCGLGFWEEGLWLHAGADAEDTAQLERFEALVVDSLRRDSEGRRHFDLPVAACSDARRELDSLTGAAWADAQGLTSPRVRWYLDYACRDDFGSSLEETSAWALLHYFCARAEGGDGETPEYMTWPEGNARLVHALAEGLDARVHLGRAVTSVRPGPDAVEVLAFDARAGAPERWLADQVVLATPQFLTRRLLAHDPAAEARAAFRYAPWVVANLALTDLPVNRGFPQAWDNVVHGSPSLGYVDAAHQLDRLGARDTVWTWYLPITGPDERAARTQLLSAPWEHWRDLILADLRLPHPDLVEHVTRIDVWRWGHAMVKPVPGLLWSEDRAAAAAPVGRVSLAGTDLSGMALFEEAHWQGVRAGEEVLARLDVPYESLL